MPSPIDSVRALFRRPEATTDQLAGALELARKANNDARAAVERQAAAVSAGYLDEATKRAKDRTALYDLRETAEDTAAIVAEAERRHAAALAADEQVRRQAVYDAARVKAAAASAALEKAYARLVQDAVAILRTLAEGQLAAEQANAHLPDGAVPIPDPEMAARGVPGRPREIVAEDYVELWSRLDQDAPVEASFQHTIYDCNNGWGKRVDDLQPAFRKRRFERTTFREAEPGSYPMPLAIALQLPALKGEGMAWGNSFSGVYNPAFSAAARGEGAPGAVLSKLAELDAAAAAKPRKIERPVKVEWGAYTDVVPLPDRPAQSYSDNPSRRSPSSAGSAPFAAPARAGRR